MRDEEFFEDLWELVRRSRVKTYEPVPRSLVWDRFMVDMYGSVDGAPSRLTAGCGRARVDRLGRSRPLNKTVSV